MVTAGVPHNLVDGIKCRILSGRGPSLDASQVVSVANAEE